MTSIQPQKKIALFLDGPNILRPELGISIKDVKDIVSKYGNILIKRVYLDRNVKSDLVQAVTNQGYEPIINLYSDDVDSFLVADAVETICTREDIDLIALATRDSDVLPAIYKARAHRKETLIVAPSFRLNIALKNSSTYYEEVGKTQA